MGRTTQAIILLSTGILIVFTVLKILLGQSDMLDKLLGLFTVILFFFDQITR